MSKLMQYVVRISITPLMLLVVFMVAYALGVIDSQFSFIIVIVIGGLSGQVLQYYITQWQMRVNGEQHEKKKQAHDEENKAKSSLPVEVQSLIDEWETVQQESKEKEGNLK